MAFTQETFAPVGANSAPTPATYSYETSDSVAAIVSAGYFIKKQDQLREGDYIFAHASGGAFIFTVTSDTSTVINSISGGDVLANRVIVTQASDLSGTLDSTVEYFIDGVVDMGSQSIEVPVGGLNIKGYNFDVSRLISSAAGYTMFVSPGGGSGNMLGTDYAVEVTGAGSQVYNINSGSGLDAFEFTRINYNNCSSLGTITGYRQGLETGTGRFGGKPELTLAGAWAGGYFIDTSIVRSLSDGVYTLFKAGAGFSMASRFRSNQNIDFPASASFLDFAPANFPNPATLQLDGCIITRNGVTNSEDANLTPNILAADLPSSWSGNVGLTNTFVGGTQTFAVEVATALSGVGVGVFLDVAGTQIPTDLQHFDAPVNGQLRHLGNSPREYRIVSDFTIDGNPNDELVLQISKWDDSAGIFIPWYSQTRPVNSLVGGRDVGFFSLTVGITLDQNDFIKLEIANNTASRDVTVEVESFMTILAR